MIADYQTDKAEPTKTAPATINQCGNCISESISLGDLRSIKPLVSADLP